MTERKPHPDNQIIDELEDQGGAPSQSGSAGGDLQRDVGSRSELHNTPEASGHERVTAADHPDAQRNAKGQRSISRLDPKQQG